MVGSLGSRDPEQKFLQNGGSVCSFMEHFPKSAPFSLGTTTSYTGERHGDLMALFEVFTVLTHFAKKY
jgi:hypothetical protein